MYYADMYFIELDCPLDTLALNRQGNGGDQSEENNSDESRTCTNEMAGKVALAPE